MKEINYITISIRDETFKLNYSLSQSQLINDLVTAYGSDHIIVLPIEYLNAFNYYVQFVNYDTNYFLYTMIDIKLLKLCFELECYLHDKEFFDAIIDWILFNWELVPFNTYDDYPPHIKTEVFMKFPLPTLPQLYTNSKTFVDTYLKHNTNEGIYICSDNHTIRYAIESEVVQTWYKDEHTITPDAVLLVDCKCEHIPTCNDNGVNNDHYIQFCYRCVDNSFVYMRRVQNWSQLYYYIVSFEDGEQEEFSRKSCYAIGY